MRKKKCYFCKKAVAILHPYVLLESNDACEWVCGDCLQKEGLDYVEEIIKTLSKEEINEKYTYWTGYIDGYCNSYNITKEEAYRVLNLLRKYL